MTGLSAYIVAPAASDIRQDEKRAIVLRVCKQAGFRAHYPVFLPTQPCFDIAAERSAIGQATVAFVDVSFERPSCYFELGLVEALSLPVLLVAETGTFIHQTSYRDGVRFYADLEEYAGLIAFALSGLR